MNEEIQLEVKLGENIKRLRLDKRMTLKEVSNRSGLSISFLSQVERSISSVTMTSLKKISEALGVSVSYFFQSNQDGASSILRKSNRVELNSQDMAFKFSNLSGGIPNPIFEPIIATLMPGETQRKPYSHLGQEFLYVLKGVLTVNLDEKEYKLMTGDSLHIDSTTPHTWYNNSTEAVELLIVTAAKNMHYF